MSEIEAGYLLANLYPKAKDGFPKELAQRLMQLELSEYTKIYPNWKEFFVNPGSQYKYADYIKPTKPKMSKTHTKKGVKAFL